MAKQEQYGITRLTDRDDYILASKSIWIEANGISLHVLKGDDGSVTVKAYPLGDEMSDPIGVLAVR